MTKWEYCELRAELHSTNMEFDAISSMELWTRSGLQLKKGTTKHKLFRASVLQKPEELIEQLSLLGDEGWELVFVTPIGPFTGIKTIGGQLFTFYFKRPA